MIIYNKAEIGRVAQQHKFARDTFEKVLRLKEILRYFNEEEFLKEHLLLKGGTFAPLSQLLYKICNKKSNGERT